MFRKRESEFCKGIGIAMMIFHHLFYKAENYQDFVISFAPFSEERINFYVLLCKVCVAIFVFISGYGITASYYKKFADWEPSVGEIKDFIWKRIWKLLTLYWFAFLLTCLCQPLGRTITEAYGGELKSKIVYFLLDFFGLSYLFGTPTLNPTWWYISLALLIILAVPWILKLFRKAGILTTICLSMGLLFLLNASNANTFYLFPVLLGAGCQEGRVFERLDEFCKKKRWGKAIKIISETVLLLFMISIRTNYNYFGIPDGIIAFLLAVLTVDVLIKIPFLSRGMCFLGKHSGNMFLIHNQIYSYYFVGLIYGCGNWIACFVMLVGVSLVVSIGMEKIKEWTQYNRWMERIGQKTGKTIFYI